MKRRSFMQMLLAGLAVFPACNIKEDVVPGPEPPAPPPSAPPADEASRIFRVRGIPDRSPGELPANHHAGVDALLGLMGENSLSFYRRAGSSSQDEAFGLIAADDVVLVKVNAQWKHRGCTNSDLVRGLIQRILEHPDGFHGEVVIIENGQGRGSLNCDTWHGYDGDTSVQANANDRRHSFQYLVDEVFMGQPVSGMLLDPLGSVFIGAKDHVRDGYRRLENVSYPCFTTARGTRVELREGIWDGSSYRQNLKLINVPVLKHHDVGGSEITAALKHFYGLLSMHDGQVDARHYQRLGETAGKMVAAVRPPVLNIVDAIWVAHKAITGYPKGNTFRANQIVASQDPVALDYWSAKNVMYPIDHNQRHHPEFAGIRAWLEQARVTINDRGGLYRPEWGIRAGQSTRSESRMQVFSLDLSCASPVLFLQVDG